MKKFIVCFLMAALGVLSLMAAWGCNNDTEPQKTITIKGETVSVDVYGYAALPEADTDAEGNIVWTVEDSSIAIISDNLVRGRSVGETYLVATVGDLSAKCPLRVYDSGKSPELSVDKSEINLFTGGEYVIDAEITYDGEKFGEGEISVSSDNPAVITADGVKLKALDSGSATVTVKGTVRGKEIGSKTITVKVVDDYDIQIDAKDNEILLNNEYVFGEKKNDSCVITYRVLKNGSAVSNNIITVSVKNEKICSFDRESGTITALAAGETTVDFTVNDNGADYTRSLNVSVSLKISTERGKDLDLSVLATKASEVTAIKDLGDGKDVPFSVKDENTLVMNPETLGERKLKLVTQSEEKEFTAIFVTHKISDAASFKNFIGETKNNVYAIVTRDIDMGGAEVTAVSGSVWATWNGGVLDGQGHTVKNFKSMSLFGHFADNMHIRNLGLKFEKIYWCEAYNGGLFGGYAGWGSIENCNFEITMNRVAGAQGVFAAGMRGMTVTDCVINLNVKGDGNGAVYTDYSGVGVNGTCYDNTVSNVYVITASDVSSMGGYGFSSAKTVSSFGGIGDLGGDFVKTEEGLFYNGEAVIASNDPQSLFINKRNTLSLSEVNSRLSGKTVSSVTIDGQSAAFTQNGDELEFGLGTLGKFPAGKISMMNITAGDESANFTVIPETFVFPTQKIAKEICKAESSFDINVKADLGVDGAVELAYLKNTTSYFTVNGDTVSLNGVEKGKEYVLVLQTNDFAYEVSLIVADLLISDAAGFKNFISNARTAKYVVVTEDIDMGGAEVTAFSGAAWITWAGGTLDGRGHTVKNFKSMSFFGHFVDDCVIKNIGLEFENIYWCENYSGVLAGGRFAWCTLENCYINITVPANDSAQAVFSAGVEGLTAKNCVINVTVTGAGTGAIYADYSGVGEYKQCADSNISNVYVISDRDLAKHGDYGFGDLITGKDISVISEIGGGFTIDEEGLKYYGKLVLSGK